MKMLDFPAKFPSKLPSNAAVQSGSELVCQGPLASAPTSSDFVIVPSAERDAANEILYEISRQLSAPQSSYYVGAGLLGAMAEHPNNIRKLYYAKISGVRAAWIEDGKKITEKVAKQISDLRKIVKDATRAQSGIPTFAYEIVDAARSKPGPQKYEILLATGQYEEAIESSFRPNAKWTNRTLIAAKAGSVLRAGSAVVLAVDMSASAAAVFFAKTEQDQQAALENLGADIGGGIGFEAGAQICVALSLTLNVAGLIGCGIVIAGLTYGGRQAGAALIGGQEANDIVSKIKSQF